MDQHRPLRCQLGLDELHSAAHTVGSTAVSVLWRIAQWDCVHVSVACVVADVASVVATQRFGPNDEAVPGGCSSARAVKHIAPNIAPGPSLEQPGHNFEELIIHHRLLQWDEPTIDEHQSRLLIGVAHEPALLLREPDAGR